MILLVKYSIVKHLFSHVIIINQIDVMSSIVNTLKKSNILPDILNQLR